MVEENKEHFNAFVERIVECFSFLTFFLNQRYVFSCGVNLTYIHKKVSNWASELSQTVFAAIHLIPKTHITEDKQIMDTQTHTNQISHCKCF